MPQAASEVGSGPLMLDVGQVTRPHGLKGEVVVALWSNRPERMEAGSELAALRRTDGEPVRTALRISASRPYGGRASSWVAAFEGVETREAAEGLRGCVLQAEPIDDPSVLWTHELVGRPVVDKGGRALGSVEAVQANPASDLLVLTGGGLVPLRFVVSSSNSGVVVDIPPGLLD